MKFLFSLALVSVLLQSNLLLGRVTTVQVDQLLTWETFCPDYEEVINRDTSETFEEFIDFVGGEGLYSQHNITNSFMIGRGTYRVEAQPVTAQYRLHYASSGEEVYRLRYYVFLNETPIPFTYDGVEAEYHDIRVPPNTGVDLDIELPTLETGIHDLVIFAIADIHEDYELRSSSNGFTQRFTMVVGDPNVAVTDRPYQILSSSVPYDPNLAVPLHFGQDDTFLVWGVGEPSVVFAPDEAITFTLKAGHLWFIYPENPRYPDSAWTNFALVLFRDTEIIPIDGENTVLYGQLSEDNAYVQFDLSFPPPHEEGRQDIIAVRIDNPGIPACLLQDAPEGMAYNAPVSISRIPVDIQAETP